MYIVMAKKLVNSKEDTGSIKALHSTRFSTQLCKLNVYNNRDTVRHLKMSITWWECYLWNKIESNKYLFEDGCTGTFLSCVLDLLPSKFKWITPNKYLQCNWMSLFFLPIPMVLSDSAFIPSISNIYQACPKSWLMAFYTNLFKFSFSFLQMEF